MRLVVRADASPAMGTGHAMRCLALAQAWRDRGGEVTFRSAGLPESLVKVLDDEEIVLDRVTETPGSNEDAQRTAALCAMADATWLVVDGYHLGSAFDVGLGLPVLRIDDRPVSSEATYFLNQNLGAEVSPSVKDALLGPHYALLRREFRTSPHATKLSQFATCIVTFGGADPKGLSTRWLALVEAGLCEAVHFVFVIGGANPLRDALVSAASGRPNVEPHVAVANMVPFLDRADFAVSAAGSTLWELAARQVPAIVIAAAEVEVAPARAVADAGAAVFLGSAENVSDLALSHAMATLAVDRERRKKMADAALQITDGLGAERVVERLLSAR